MPTPHARNIDPARLSSTKVVKPKVLAGLLRSRNRRNLQDQMGLSNAEKTFKSIMVRGLGFHRPARGIESNLVAVAVDSAASAPAHKLPSTLPSLFKRSLTQRARGIATTPLRSRNSAPSKMHGPLRRMLRYTLRVRTPTRGGKCGRGKT